MNALIRYTALLVWGVLLLSSCTRELRGGYEPLPEGTPITMSFEAAVPVDEPSLRSSSEATSLWLLVFDEHHQYLYRSKAVVTAVNASVNPSEVRPDNQGNGPSGGRNKFTVTLLASSKKRYIHFISNYDFSEEGPNHFKPDHQLLKSDEGQIIPKLFTEDQNGKVAGKVYWRVFDFDNLNEHSFDNVDFRLLRNRARIKVTAKSGLNFIFHGFCVHNAPNKGTVAPYYAKTVGQLAEGDSREMYTNVAYCFPSYPKHATMMGGYQLQAKMTHLGYKEGALDNKNAIEVYEYDNKMSEVETSGGKKGIMSVIVYGKLNGAPREGYYKLDIAKTINEGGNVQGKELLPVIRNHTYAITIEDVRGEGYATYDEAARQPASNNIFASVELEEYGGVSDGKYSLIVENTNGMMLLPGQFSVGINFFSANENLNNDVKVFLMKPDGKSGDLCKGKIEPNDGFVEYANYNGDLGRLYVNVKQIPPSQKVYTFKVVGTKGKSVVERTITLTLRPRFKFNAELTEPEHKTDNPQTERVDLTFTVPGTLPKTLFPYKVRVAADFLTPYVGHGVNDGIKVVSEGTRVYYEYLVKNPTDGHDRTETIHFQRSRTDKSCVVTLMSDYYVDGDVLLKERKSENSPTRVPLLFRGLSYTDPRWVPSDYRTTLTGSDPYIANVKMITAGYAEFYDYGGYGSHLNEDYTVTAKVKEAGGSVTSRMTKTVQEWVNLMQNSNAQAILDIEEIEIEGEIYYQDWLTHPELFKTRGPLPVPASTSGFTITNNLGKAEVIGSIQMTGEGKFKMKVSGLKGINEPMAIKVGHSGISGSGHLESYALYIGSLLDVPTIYINEHKDGN